MMLDLLLILTYLLVPILIGATLVFGLLKTTKQNIRIRLRCLSVIIFPIALCTTVLTIPALYNQVRLIRFGQQLYDYPLPPQTREIDRDWKVHNITDNGTWYHCMYTANRTVQTALSLAQVEEYYENVLFDPIGDESFMIAITGRDGKLTASVDFIKDDSGIAVISLTDGAYEGTFITIDPRCWSP